MVRSTLFVVCFGILLSSVALAAAPATQPAKAYPLDTCIVSGEKLGGMGEPVVFNQDGQEVKFCCESCEASFKKDPQKYLAKLAAAKPTTKPS